MRSDGGMRSFPGAVRVGLALPLLLAACGGGESLPDDPRPVASAGLLVPPAAVSAVLAPAPPMRTGPGIITSPAPPSVREDPPVLSRPGLPPEVVRRITRQNFGALKACYAHQTSLDPTPGGSITVRYVIDPTGSVTTATFTSSTLSDPAMNACVVAVFQRLSFPAPSGGAIVANQTIYFVPAPP